MAPLRTPENAAHVACSSGNLFREEIQGGGEEIFRWRRQFFMPDQSRGGVEYGFVVLVAVAAVYTARKGESGHCARQLWMMLMMEW